MNDIVLQMYVNKLNKDHIIEYAKKNNIILSNNEVDIIYEYIKKYYKRFYNEYPEDLLLELKNKLSKETYDNLIKLYNDVKKINIKN